MKRQINKIWFLAGGCLLALAACKKDEAKVYLESGTPPVLSASQTGTIPLPVTDTLANAVTFSWTNPNYQFNTGISSLNVSYSLQFDTVGGNFTSPVMRTLTYSPDISATMTVSVFNSFLANNMGLLAGMSHNLQVRVQSYIKPLSSGSPEADTLNSNSLNFTVTPYSPPPVVTPPASGELWLVGGDTKLGAWANPVPAAQQFTKISNTEYKITIALSGGDPTNGSDQYLFLPVNGSWSNKYASSATPAGTLSGGGTFGYNLSNNFAGPSSAGTYTIDVNFQSGIYTVTQN
ncbi:SusE domain-containing protein [Dinghuibacter silviterrae]|uniref:SusE-like outer membrane protein n=1 Tax=Dinghuibacter silviterrae TaxID=1539049 RepID=A0A4R8DPF4_9BACT|nr:SusE domain-containing protein [Dinghuibacter silviterrae]TDW99963.1 SusE-like outer membrane protein [Dinghuibacter silviterrae]